MQVAKDVDPSLGQLDSSPIIAPFAVLAFSEEHLSSHILHVPQLFFAALDPVISRRIARVVHNVKDRERRIDLVRQLCSPDHPNRARNPPGPGLGPRPSCPLPFVSPTDQKAPILAHTPVVRNRMCIRGLW